MSIVAETLTWLTDPLHWVGPNGIPIRLAEHVAISGISLLLAAALALPIGLWIGHTGRGTRFAVNVTNLGRALPSLAVIGIALPITAAIDPQLGFKVYPTLIAMVILAVPPILVNAQTGIGEVDRDLVEAARGIGFGEGRVLWRLELPIALPVIVGGFRSAGVQVVSTATLGAVVGFGGLGRYIVDGVSQNDDGQLYGGVVLVAGLAILLEMSLALLQRGLTSPGLRLERREPPTAASLSPGVGRL